MCGICGVRRFGPEPITQEQIISLLVGNERRGIQATGLALQQMDGSIQVWKVDEPANRAVGMKTFSNFLEENLLEDTLCFIGHTRAATKGDAAFEKNNHPMWDGKVAVVHNGVLTNDDHLFREWKLDRVADTDSDIFRAVLSKEGFTVKGIDTCCRVSGSAAIAALSTEHPGKLLLARSGNPVVLSTTDNQLIWSSEKQPIYDALRIWQKRFGIWTRKARPDVGYNNLPNDTAWLIGDIPTTDEVGDATWIEWHQAFRVASYFNAPTYRVHETYHTRRKSEKTRLMLCPNLECMTNGKRTWIQLTATQRENLKHLVCRKCKVSLSQKGVE